MAGFSEMPVTKHGEHIHNYHMNKWLKHSAKNEINYYIETKLKEFKDKLRSKSLLHVSGTLNNQNQYIFADGSNSLSFPYNVTLYARTQLPDTTKIFKNQEAVEYAKGIDMKIGDKITISGKIPKFQCTFVLVSDLF